MHVLDAAFFAPGAILKHLAAALHSSPILWISLILEGSLNNSNNNNNNSSSSGGGDTKHVRDLVAALEPKHFSVGRYPPV
jgi:hypothetical protein